MATSHFGWRLNNTSKLFPYPWIRGQNHAAGQNTMTNDVKKVAKIVVRPKFWPRKLCTMNRFWPRVAKITIIFGHALNLGNDFGHVWRKSSCILATSEVWPPINFGHSCLNFGHPCFNFGHAWFFRGLAKMGCRPKKKAAGQNTVTNYIENNSFLGGRQKLFELLGA